MHAEAMSVLHHESQGRVLAPSNEVVAWTVRDKLIDLDQGGYNYCMAGLKASILSPIKRLLWNMVHKCRSEDFFVTTFDSMMMSVGFLDPASNIYCETSVCLHL